MKAAGRVRRQFRPGGVILMYHRIASLPGDPLSLAVSAEHFASQLDYLAQTCQPLRLLDLAAALEGGTVPRRAVAITFDDGYSDNYQAAFPLLAAARIPATMFITSDLIDSRREFWWDELERILLAATDTPRNLTLEIAGQNVTGELASPADRQHAYATIYRLLKPRLPCERYRVLQSLSEWAGTSLNGRPDYRALSTTELRELAASSWVEIGGHTQGHPQLSALSDNEQQQEIAGGKLRLEELIGKPIETFAYPYGAIADFSSTTVNAVSATGFRAAVTTVHGYCEPGDDVFRLRRCAVFDWPMSTFQQKLEEFFVIRP